MLTATTRRVSRSRPLRHRATSIAGLVAFAAPTIAVVGVAQPIAAPTVTAAGCEPNEILVNPCRPWVGAASNGYISGGFRAAIEYHEARAGRQMDIVHDYHGPGDVLTADDVFLATRPNTIALINYKPSGNWSAAGGGNASVDAGIDRMAESISALGDTKIMLTIAHEPENNVSPGGDPACPDTRYRGNSGTVADYRAMWHNVRARFDALGVDNVVWVMNYLGYDRWDCLVPGLWPGNEYVDWLMWDPYPGNRLTFESIVGRFYDVLTEASDAEHDFLSKPWGLAEYGYVGSSQSQAYQFYADILRHAKDGRFPKLRAYVNWDGVARYDNRVAYARDGTPDPSEQAAYNALVNDPFFTDPVDPDLTPPDIVIANPTDGATVTGTIDVDGPAGDDVAVATCELLVDGVITDTAPPDVDVCAFSWDTTTVADGPHTVALAATDTSGNPATSTTITVDVSNPPDLTPPPPPSSVTATPASGPRVDLTWDADLADPDLAGFVISRDGTELATIGPVTSFTDSAVTAGTTYTYGVASVDAAGNASVGIVATATVPEPTGPDEEPPSRVGWLVAEAEPDGIHLSWETATDDVAIGSYYLFRANLKYVRLPGSQTTFVDEDVTPGVRYVYKVYAIDTSNKWGGSSPRAAARAL